MGQPGAGGFCHSRHRIDSAATCDRSFAQTPEQQKAAQNGLPIKVRNEKRPPQYRPFRYFLACCLLALVVCACLRWVLLACGR